MLWNKLNLTLLGISLFKAKARSILPKMCQMYPRLMKPGTVMAHTPWNLLTFVFLYWKLTTFDKNEDIKFILTLTLVGGNFTSLPFGLLLTWQKR